MNPATGTFITQDTYAGAIFDPTSLHKYLYARSGAKSYNTIWEEQFEMWGGNFTKEMIENFFKSLTRKW